ncbi:MAG: hypothetical protein ACW98D_20430 [Promethearchaeota archaeon]|jgi:acyl carrier protein
MKISEVMDDILSEGPQTSDVNKKNLKVFYKTDILIQGFPERRAEEEPEEKPAAGEEDVTATGEEDVATAESTMLEDILKTSSQGELTIPIDEADNIQTLEDLIDYLGDKNDGGKPIINELVEEVVLSVAGVGAKPLENLVNEGDKVFIDIDYGKERSDSVGFRVNKQAGSTAMSISMKKDNKIIPGEFDIEQFNKQLVYYRNSLFGD